MIRKKSASRGKSRHNKNAQETPVKKAVRWGVVACIWGGLFILALVAWYGKDLNRIARSMNSNPKQVITVLARDGETQLAHYGNYRGDNVRIEDLPEHIPNAFIAIEDRRFYGHFGVDLIGVMRAMVANIKAGGIVQGGSTITQQLAKNLFFDPQRTLKRKIQEALLALWIEMKYSKEEILSAYLNRVYFGSGAYGIDAAAEIYFDKDAEDLGLKEAALLAGLVQAPSRLSPSHNKEDAIARMKVVLNEMLQAGFISPGMIADIDDVRIVDGKPQGMEFRDQLKSARYFTDWIKRQAETIAADVRANLIITTTLDAGLQDRVADIVTVTLDKNYPEGGDKERPEAAAVLLDRNGAIRAMVGGYDYEESQFNRATDAIRQPGSSFKPFVYLAAIEQGWRPNHLISNERITSGRYRPANYDGEYTMEATLDEALTHSYNVATVRLLQEIGVSHLSDLAARVGIDAVVKEELSTALGTTGMTLLDLTGAYGTLSQSGRLMRPFGITKITTEEGIIIYQHQPTPPPVVVSHRHVAPLTYMLQNVVEYGTGRRARTGFPVAGKTGTTQDYRDALFVGYSSEFTLGVWMGRDDNTSLGRVFGGTIPAEIWRQSMQAAHENVAARPLTPYDGTQDMQNPFKSFLNNLFSGERRSAPPPFERIEPNQERIRWNQPRPGDNSNPADANFDFNE